MQKAITFLVVVITAIYFACGIPLLATSLDAPPLFQVTGAVLLACCGLGISGCAAALAGRLRLARWLVLPAMAVAAIVVIWPQGWIMYPSFLTAPLTIFLRHGDGTMYGVGVNALPAALFIALAFVLRAPPKAPGEESVSAGSIDEAAGGA